jgi:ribokinase
MKNILVVGSINMDMVITVDRVPKMGETLSGDGFMTIPGGKGANQALTMARLLGNVKMLGCVGKDSFGSELTSYLKESGVDTSSIMQTDKNTGVALITVCNGDNVIVLEKGANYEITPESVLENKELFKWADIVVMQLEIPWETVMQAAKTAKENGCTVLLNPAPVENFKDEILEFVDIIVPNEHEGGIILGKENVTKDEAKDLVLEFLEKGVKAVVTLGGDGCVYYDDGTVKHQPAMEAKVVDTTAAGDSFIGGMCVAMCEDKPFSEAIAFATRVASIVVSRKGAGTSIPWRNEI